MTGILKLSSIRDVEPPEEDPAHEWESQLENARKIAEVISTPLQRAINAWNRRMAQGKPLVGKERGDLDDRIEDETWLLHHHGYSVLSTIYPGGHKSASVNLRPGDSRPPAFGYDVYSHEDLPFSHKPPTPYPATGGERPGEFEQARCHADRIGGVVLEWRRWTPGDEGGDHLRCVYLSSAIMPKSAYEAFMEMYDDGTVISRFMALFKHMLRREHREVDAVVDREPQHYQHLGEIAYYLGEVRSWKADRDWRLAQGKI